MNGRISGLPIWFGIVAVGTTGFSLTGERIGRATEWQVPRSVRAAPDRAKIVVGANVHVSKAKDGIQHTESVIAAHPTNFARLFIASMHNPGIVGYYSEDGGGTWKPSFERKSDPAKGDRQEIVCDPAAAFGPDGSLYFVCLSYWHPKTLSEKSPAPKFGDPDVGRLEFTRSTDGGKTWGAARNIPTFTDRPWLAVDCTEGKYRGRLYCFATIDKPVLHVLQDQGKTFAAPLTWPVKAGLMPRPANPVVLTDGTLVMICGLDPQNYVLDESNPKARVQLVTLLSCDGGASFQLGAPISTYWGDIGLFRFAQLATDTATKKYRDRLYAVWTDGAYMNRVRRARMGRSQARILFSFSKDKGRSWAEPRTLSEQPAIPEIGKDYAAFLPSIAVNKNGVVAVSWYDRRGLADRADDVGLPAGWNVRFRISLDGGESWQPSIQVNEKAGKSRCGELRETAGLAADAVGHFHPVWIDDRTGKRQVWTTTVKLEAK